MRESRNEAYEMRTGNVRITVAPPAPDRSATQTRVDGHTAFNLIRELYRDTGVMIRQEVDLAKAEMSEKVSYLGRNSAYLGIGGGVALLGLFALIAAASVGLAYGLMAAGLADYIAWWLGPLIVGAVVCVIGYIFIHKGLIAINRTKLVPEKTAQSLQENKEWLKNELK